MRARDDEVRNRALALLERGRGTARTVDPDASPRASPADVPPPVVATPTALRGALTQVSWPAVVGLVVLLLVVAAVVGVRVTLAQQAAAPVGVTPTTAPAGRPDEPPGSTSPGARPHEDTRSATPPVPTSVVVDVAGAVRSPGVQRLPAGARVVDALARAGGTTADGDLTGLNRARVLADGELLRVPRRGEVPSPAPLPPGGGPSPGAPSTPGTPGVDSAGPVDLNSADETTLDALPGIGPALAGRILDWRREHGRFSTVDELGEVSGIGTKVMERLRPLVRVGP